MLFSCKGCDHMPKSKYYTHIQPHLAEVETMALTMTEEQMAKTLGVGKSAWYGYKLEHVELVEAIKKGRLRLVGELKSTLIMKAKGYDYEEKKTVVKGGEVVSEEIYRRRSHPDVAAIHLLLKNFDDDWRNDDRETMDMKKRQVDIQERKADGW